MLEISPVTAQLAALQEELSSTELVHLQLKSSLHTWQRRITVTNGMNSSQLLPTVQYSTLVSQLTKAGGYVEEVVVGEKYEEVSIPF
jgi:hypothetical protein